jgi:uncharacterized membrane protein YjgN (DUF898 family)
VFTALTLGLALPWGQVAKQRYRLGNVRFGNREGRFDGSGGDLFRTYIICWLLAPFTLGLSIVWYQAAMIRYTADRFTIGNLAFCSSVTGGSLFLLLLTNMLILMFTFGLGMPWVMTRSLRFFTDHTQVSGQADYASIYQTQEKTPSTAEGFAEGFDLGAI